MKKIIVSSIVAGSLLMPVSTFADSVVFSKRADADKFLEECLKPSEYESAKVTGRQDPSQRGFTIFWKSISNLPFCPRPIDDVCNKRCIVQDGEDNNN